jgi:integrative and conjugative element protein (TIGR02256 family)
MKLLLPHPVLKRLRREMGRAGRREIGGLLLGEHIGDETFRLVDVTVQRSGGSSAHFIRDPAQHQMRLDSFFAETGRDFTRYNYLGEWHSHPSFQPLPSSKDISTMQALVENAKVGVNFAVLIIARIGFIGGVQISASLFRPSSRPEDVQIVMESEAFAESRFLKINRWIKHFIPG